MYTRLLVTRGDNLRRVRPAATVWHARDHTVVCGNKTQSLSERGRSYVGHVRTRRGVDFL